MYWIRTLGMFAVMTAMLMAVGAIVSWFFAGSFFIGMGVMLVISVLMSVFSYFKCKDMALKANKAHIITREQNPRLYSIVEKVAAQAEVPMPEVGVVYTPVPNAFATGRGPQDAAVVATIGLLDSLNDEELEGVIAHEMAHVKNRDILVMSIASVIATIVGYLAQWGGMFMMMSNDRDNPWAPLVGLVLYLTFPIAAMMVQLGISRNREYLADKTGAKFTGNPKALANALRKISGFDMEAYTVKTSETARRTRNYEGSSSDPFNMSNSSAATKSCEYAHMWISSPLTSKQRFASLFSTHPPIEERIKRLESM